MRTNAGSGEPAHNTHMKCDILDLTQQLRWKIGVVWNLRRCCSSSRSRHLFKYLEKGDTHMLQPTKTNEVTILAQYTKETSELEIREKG